MTPPENAACICAALLPIGGEPKPCPVHGWTGCIRCGGAEDLMDRGMAPGMTYCAPCRKAMSVRLLHRRSDRGRGVSAPRPLDCLTSSGSAHG